jgi:hypothetical protein
MGAVEPADAEVDDGWPQMITRVGRPGYLGRQ